MLTHHNFVVNISCIDDNLNEEDRYSENDVYISYLPLAHVYERLMLTISMAIKMQIGFYSGDVLKLTQDLAVLKPTVMVSVPRIYSRFYDLMQAKIKELTGMRKTLTEWGIQKKLAALRDNAEVTDSFYDVLVFNKFKEILGGRVKKLITGSAPIDRDILNFLKIAFCVQILEGYGQTESAGGVTISSSFDPESGHVGAPFPAVEVKLIDVPEMNYKSEDVNKEGRLCPRGEICYRGYNVFKGYYKNKEMTKETVDSEGWMHSGDIGQLDPIKGIIRIIDRKKNIFKLS